MLPTHYWHDGTPLLQEWWGPKDAYEELVRRGLECGLEVSTGTRQASIGGGPGQRWWFCTASDTPRHGAARKHKWVLWTKWVLNGPGRESWDLGRGRSFSFDVFDEKVLDRIAAVHRTALRLTGGDACADL